MAKEKAKQLAQQPKLTSFLSPRPEVDTAGAADLQLTAQLEELPRDQLEDLTPLPEPLSPLLTSLQSSLESVDSDSETKSCSSSGVSPVHMPSTAAVELVTNDPAL